MEVKRHDMIVVLKDLYGWAVKSLACRRLKMEAKRPAKRLLLLSKTS